jgi:hypothetical protein
MIVVRMDRGKKTQKKTLAVHCGHFFPEDRTGKKWVHCIRCHEHAQKGVNTGLGSSALTTVSTAAGIYMTFL